jgi:hypothetical protein
MRDEVFMQHLKQCELKSLHQIMTHRELQHYAEHVLKLHKPEWKKLTNCPYCGKRLG